MATGGLYGNSGTGALVATPGAESSGLYGNTTNFGGTYFEWFIFQVSETQPATPTGGSWSFSTNSGTPPSGWTSSPPVSPTNTVWVSISIVTSRNTSSLTWSVPGKFSFSSGLPILSGSGAPLSGDGQSDQLYVQLDSTPQTIWFKESGTWTRLTGSTLYADLTSNQTIAGTKTFSSEIQGSISGTAANVTGIVSIANGGTDATTAADALANLGGIGEITSSDASIEILQTGTSVNLQVSQDSPASTLLAQVRNQTGATLTKGTIVYISGGSGNKALVSKALATSDATSASTFGMITADIPNNQNGYVTISGIVSGLNTSAYPDGTILYLSGTTAGAYTGTKPYAPTHLVYVGVVTYSHVNQGSIQTRIQNGYELDELHNVSAQTPSNGNMLVYNSANSLWEASSTLPVNPTFSGGTANGVTYLNGSKVLTSGSALQFDGVNLGLGVTPSAWLSGTKAFQFGASSVYDYNSNANIGNNFYLDSGGTSRYINSAFASVLQQSNGQFKWFTAPSGTAGAAITFTQAMTLNSSGNLGIGTSSPAALLHASKSYTTPTGGISASTVGIFSQNNTASASANVSILSRSSGSSVLQFGNEAIENVANIISSGATPYLSFGVASSNTVAATERMRLDSSGNLGIGTSSPDVLGFGGSWKVLSVVGAGGALQLVSTSTSAGANLGSLAFGSSGVTAADKVSASIRGVKDNATVSNAAASLQFFTSNGTANTERMRLDSSGNLGLGVTPSAWSVYKAYQVGRGALVNATTETDLVHNAYWNGTNWIYNATDFASRHLQINGQHRFYTAASGTAGNAITFTQAMTLDASGNLLVGLTSLASTTTGFALQANIGAGIFQHATGTGTGTYFSAFYYGPAAIGSITQSGTTAVLYNTTSDQRLKENIQDAAPASALIDSIQVREYDWKSDGTHQRYGFIAQELVTVAPEAVHQPADPEAMMAVDYSKLVPMLVKEIQSLRQRLAAAGIA